MDVQYVKTSSDYFQRTDQPEALQKRMQVILKELFMYISAFFA